MILSVLTLFLSTFNQRSKDFVKVFFTEGVNLMFILKNKTGRSSQQQGRMSRNNFLVLVIRQKQIKT